LPALTVGTVFDRSKIPLHEWVMLTELLYRRIGA
jgi:hypothetical protein